MHEFILCESEGRKAGFLNKVVTTLELQNVTVMSARAEKAVLECKPDVVFSRAVGTLDKLYGWIRACSTWNSLILYKSRSWSEEWATSKSRKNLELKTRQPYTVCDDVERVLVVLQRR